MSVQPGDRVKILSGENGSGWLKAGALATVDYLLPDYGKIICKLDEPSGPHTSCCLYNSQEGEHWEALAKASPDNVGVTCPSCGGLNTSCPDGCGRDEATGELNGTTHRPTPSGSEA